MAKHRNPLPDNVQWHEQTKRFMARKMYKGHRYCAYHLTSAKLALKELESMIDEAKRKGTPSKVLLKDYIDKYLDIKQERDNIRDNSMHNIRYICDHYIRIYEDTKMQEFDPQAFMDELKTSLAPSTLRNVFAALNGILGLARRDGVIRFVADDIILPRAVKKTKGMVPVEVIDKFMKSIAHSTFFDIIYFSMHTGLRREDVVALKWTDFNFKKHTLTIQRFYISPDGGKTWRIEDEGKTRLSRRTIPIYPWLSKFMAQRPKLGEYVFYNASGNMYHPSALANRFKQMTTAFGLEMSWHGMRHQFASTLINQGVSPEVIAYLLGHATIQMTQQYAHIAFEYAEKTLNGVRAGVNKKNDAPASAEAST